MFSQREKMLPAECTLTMAYKTNISSHCHLPLGLAFILNFYVILDVYQRSTKNIFYFTVSCVGLVEIWLLLFWCPFNLYPSEELKSTEIFNHSHIDLCKSSHTANLTNISENRSWPSFLFQVICCHSHHREKQIKKSLYVITCKCITFFF